MWRSWTMGLLLVGAQVAHGEDERVVTGSGLRVRARADATSTVLERLELGATVPCLARTGDATLGDRRGGFCRTRLADGREGFFFEPLTGPFDRARPEAAWQAIVDERTAALAQCATQRKEDVWGYQRFLLARAAAATSAAERARWGLLELRLLRVQACLYAGADPRFYVDEAQGPRLKREAIWSFVDRVKGTPSAEEAAWLAIEHGHDFECEGSLPCLLGWTRHVEGEYLVRFPDGPHAQDAVRGIAEAARNVLAALEKREVGPADMGAKDLEMLAAVRGAIARAKGEAARAADQALSSIEVRLRAFASKTP